MTYSLHLERSSRARSGMCLGGMGTGGVELYPDGIFRSWRIFNNAPFGSGPAFSYPDDSMLFFIVRWQVPGQEPRLKLLQIEEGLESGGIEIQPYIFPWLSGVDSIDYAASFPFVRLSYHDAEMPFTVELEAFSPFIPRDVKNSALPVILLNFSIRSHAGQPAEVSLYATLRSAAGYGLPERIHKGEAGLDEDSGWIQMHGDGVPADHPAYGWQALASLSPGSSYHLGWSHHHPYYEHMLRSPRLLDQNWITDQGDPGGNPVRFEKCFGSMAATRQLAPGEAWQPAFLVAWNYPNLLSEAKEGCPAEWIGYYHSNFFSDAKDVIAYAREQREMLSDRTRAFQQAFFDSSLDPVVLEQVNSQLNTFITSSWVSRAGVLVVQEGMTPGQYWGPQATIDVALYGGVAALALFPELDQSTWRAHAALQKPAGEISHGIPRNFQFFEPERPGAPTRIDLQAQFAILVLRNVFFTGDLAYLREMWPAVTRALDFALADRDQDGDGIPDLSGVNSSYDNLAMYGAAAYMGSIWLSALDHAIRAAELLEDLAGVERYQAIRTRAAASFEKRLWNGRCYRLYNDAGNPAPDRGSYPEVDEGCFTDQLIGQWSNRLPGLGPLVDPGHIRSALEEILLLGYRPGFGLRNCSWPETPFVHEVPAGCWWDQANTLWSGTELGFAALLLYEGFYPQAVDLIRTIDRRYRRMGLYFNHMEWGGHYFRAQSAWAVVNGALGLSVCLGNYTFAPKLPGQRVRLFFAFASGYGHYEEDRPAGQVSLKIEDGCLALQTLSLPGWEMVPNPIVTTLNHQSFPCHATGDGHGVHLAFPAGLELHAGDVLSIDGLFFNG